MALLFFLPITLPGLFLGLALFSFFNQGGLQLNTSTIILAHCVYVFPFFFIIARAAVQSLDPAIEEIARDLGASRFQAFRKAVLPTIWPVLAGATALSFMLSFDEFVVTFFVAGADETLPLYLFAALRRQIDPTVNVISTVLLLITLLIGFLATIAISRGVKNTQDFVEDDPVSGEPQL